MAAYYNEIDPYAADWLRNLIAAGHIAPGDVDTRSIVDVQPDDLRGYSQCHFFAGIGVWSHALRRAGWRDDEPVWTGSCPCQPFSAAGRGDAFSDERHLWPAFHRLIAECRPPVVFGEQVSSKVVDQWVDLVQADLEALDYAFGAVPFPAASLGAPHIRDRLYWVADAQHDDWRSDAPRRGSFDRAVDGGRRGTDGLDLASGGGQQGLGHQSAHGEPLQAGENDGRLAATARCGDASGSRLEGCDARALGHERSASERDRAGAGDLADAKVGDQLGHGGDARSAASSRQGEAWPAYGHADRGAGGLDEGTPGHGAGPLNGFWRDADWLFCRDGRWRPVEPGTSPLAHGAPARVGRLRAYGNAIVAEQAVVWIEEWRAARRDLCLTPMSVMTTNEGIFG